MKFYLEEVLVIGDGDACSLIQYYLEKHKTVFQQSLIPDLSYLHENAESTTGIDIDTVERRNNAIYILRYSYHWFIYNGCLDLDEQGKSFASVDFTVNNKGAIEFDLSIFGKDID